MSVTFDDRDRESVVRDLASSDEEARRLAVERVGVLPLDEALPLLVERLGDPSWRVRKVTVRVVDINGPRGGIDKRCRIVVLGGPRRDLICEARGTDIASSVSACLRKAERQLYRRRAVSIGLARAVPSA